MRPRWRSLLKRITPPIVVDLGRSLTSRRYVWAGIYNDFSDVPVEGPGFAGRDWAETCAAAVRDLLVAQQTTVVAPDDTHGARFLLPLVAALRFGDRCTNGHPIRILDFGGGAGLDYGLLRTGLGREAPIDYHVVENPALCEVGRALFPGDDAIRFTPTLPVETTVFDVVYVNSALQYVRDYRVMLRRLSAYRAAYLLVVRHPAGNIRTLATAQRNHPGSVIATWWFNARELIDLVGAKGYVLAYQSRMPWPFDTSNFPPGSRLDAYHNFLFVRRAETT